MKHLNRELPASLTLFAQIQNAYNILSVLNTTGNKTLFDKFNKANKVLEDFVNELDKVSKEQIKDAQSKELPKLKTEFLKERFDFLSIEEVERLVSCKVPPSCFSGFIPEFSEVETISDDVDMYAEDMFNFSEAWIEAGKQGRLQQFQRTIKEFNSTPVD